MAKATSTNKGIGKAKRGKTPRAPSRSGSGPKERLTLDQRNDEEASGYQYLPKATPKSK